MGEYLLNHYCVLIITEIWNSFGIKEKKWHKYFKKWFLPGTSEVISAFFLRKQSKPSHFPRFKTACRTRTTLYIFDVHCITKKCITLQSMSPAGPRRFLKCWTEWKMDDWPDGSAFLQWEGFIPLRTECAQQISWQFVSFRISCVLLVGLEER